MERPHRKFRIYEEFKNDKMSVSKREDSSELLFYMLSVLTKIAPCSILDITVFKFTLLSILNQTAQMVRNDIRKFKFIVSIKN